MVGGEFGTDLDAADQVGVGDEEAAEGDGVGAVAADGFGGGFGGEAAGVYQDRRPQLAEGRGG